ALVFGGGHVVLPLLQKAVADPGRVDRSTFLAGYGAAQAVPGPLFSFAAFLLVFAAAPLWSGAQHHPRLRAAVTGVNAAVVGLLAAALYSPVWTGAVFALSDVLIVLVLLVLLLWRQVPPFIIVILAVLFAFVAPR